MNSFLMGAGAGIGQGLAQVAPNIVDYAKISGQEAAAESAAKAGVTADEILDKILSPEEKEVVKDVFKSPQNSNAVQRLMSVDIQELIEKAGLTPEQAKVIEAKKSILQKGIGALNEAGMLAQASKEFAAPKNSLPTAESQSPSVMPKPEVQSSLQGQVGGGVSMPAPNWQRETVKSKITVPNAAEKFLEEKFNTPLPEGADEADIALLESLREGKRKLASNTPAANIQKFDDAIKQVEDRINEAKSGVKEAEKTKIGIATDLAKNKNALEIQSIINKRSAEANASRERIAAANRAMQFRIAEFKANKSNQNKDELVKTIQLAIKNNEDTINRIAKARKDYSKNPEKQIEEISVIAPDLIQSVVKDSWMPWGNPDTVKNINEDAISAINKQTRDYKDFLIQVKAGFIDDVPSNILNSDYGQQDNAEDDFWSLPGAKR